MPGEAEEAVIEQRAVALGADAFAEVDYAVGADANEVLLVGGVMQRRHRDAVAHRGFAAGRVGDDVRRVEQLVTGKPVSPQRKLHASRTWRQNAR